MSGDSEPSDHTKGTSGPAPDAKDPETGEVAREEQDPSDRPSPPFTVDGVSRVGVVSTASGGVVVRPGEWTIDLRAAGTNAESVIELLGGEAVVVAQPVDLRRAERLAVLRIDVRDERAFADRLAKLAEGSTSDKAVRSATRPHAVFLVGALTAAPMHLSPMHLSPMHLSAGYGGDPTRFWYSSTARPAPAPSGDLVVTASCEAGPIIAILDTGVPKTLAAANPKKSDVELPNPDGSVLVDRADVNDDRYLDIAAGHTTFIRSIITRAAPSAQVWCLGVMENDGDGDEAHVADALLHVFDTLPKEDLHRLIVNLSFGGYYDGDVEPPMVAAAIRLLTDGGAVVVAAAGNDGICRKQFPAAMGEVVGVGALGPCGPAPFSNHGPWVEASAPGEDLVSEFFSNFDGAFEPVDQAFDDIDKFDGWAMWSGTSFATPAVVGAIAEAMSIRSLTAREALDLVVRRPGLLRIPDYGVVVNRIF
ncbi:MAG: S8 family serine peptidase [Ilumatobacter sp.]